MGDKKNENLSLFSEGGAFRKKFEPTAPAIQDADLINNQTVTDLNGLPNRLKPPPPKRDWRHINLKAMFDG